MPLSMRVRKPAPAPLSFSDYVPSRIRRLRRQETEIDENGLATPESPDSPNDTPSPPGVDSPDSPEGAEEEKEEDENENETATSAQPLLSGGARPSETRTMTSTVSITTTIPIQSLGPTFTGSSSTLPSAPTLVSEADRTANAEPQVTDGPRKSKGGHEPLSGSAKGALITFLVLSVIALGVGSFLWYRRRQRMKREKNNIRHLDDPFPPPDDYPIQPEVVHINRSTRSTDSGLFAGDPDHRPITVSTDRAASRNQAPLPHGLLAPPGFPSSPLPSANPFNDASRNKAYDVLRGRPRSTTLTDRGSWVGNPFKDPMSGRFDPFGELEEKAKAARFQYMEEVRRERETEEAVRRENDFLERQVSGKAQ